MRLVINITCLRVHAALYSIMELGARGGRKGEYMCVREGAVLFLVGSA